MLWAGAIIAATSIPGRAVPRVGVPHVDKLVHFVLYAILGYLVARALRGRERASARVTVGALVRWAFGMALFAAIDEWHQRWVPGRGSDFADWCFDLVGGTIALLLFARPVARVEHLT